MEDDETVEARLTALEERVNRLEDAAPLSQDVSGQTELSEPAERPPDAAP